MDQQEIDLIYSYLVLRCIQLLQQCPQQLRIQYESVVEQLRDLMDQWKLIDDMQTRVFIGHLMLAATRAYEGYDFYYDNGKRKKYFKHNPEQDINQSILIVRAFLQHPPELMLFQNNFFIQLAENMLKRCKNLISIICKQKVTDQSINKYFSKSIFIQFSHNSNYLMGLSSYHGRITYINLNLSPMDIFVTIIHEFAHNISRFLMKKKKVVYLSPKKNKKLRAWSFQKKELYQLEAGNFIENRLFGIKYENSSPFGLKQFY